MSSGFAQAKTTSIASTGVFVLPDNIVDVKEIRSTMKFSLKTKVDTSFKSKIDTIPNENVKVFIKEGKKVSNDNNGITDQKMNDSASNTKAETISVEKEWNSLDEISNQLSNIVQQISQIDTLEPKGTEISKTVTPSRSIEMARGTLKKCLVLPLIKMTSPYWWIPEQSTIIPLQIQIASYLNSIMNNLMMNNPTI